MNPTQTCSTCERSRDCTLHMSAEFPPDAAVGWLHRTCPLKDTPVVCTITYLAGIG